MYSSKAIFACSLLVMGCAAAEPQDCADEEGPCLASGATATPDLGAKLQVGVAATSALPAHYPFWVLQLNLCNSGIAKCYDGGKSVPEAATAIQNSAPDVVMLNEICRDDVAPLAATLAGVYSGSTVVSAFQAATDRRTNAPYKCKNGQDYGIGLLVHIPGTDAGHQVFGGIYASQDTGSAEERAWLCIQATGSFYACTTHLASTSGSIALSQCQDLMNHIVPSVRSAGGGYAPTVIGGDLNMKYRGSPDAQSCVPPGYFRKGDGDVQHIMATTDFAFSSSRTIGMSHTDHDGWFVALTAP
jgi:endonuclease/exonuclease/phosphatase family metal-dependent hydrolase